MFSLNDVKFVAECQYSVHNKFKNHNEFVKEIIDIIDMFYLIENIKLKEEELIKIIE